MYVLCVWVMLLFAYGMQKSEFVKEELGPQPRESSGSVADVDGCIANKAESVS